MKITKTQLTEMIREAVIEQVGPQMGAALMPGTVGRKSKSVDGPTPKERVSSILRIWFESIHNSLGVDFRSDRPLSNRLDSLRNVFKARALLRKGEYEQLHRHLQSVDEYDLRPIGRLKIDLFAAASKLVGDS